jgi:hypothetical protein
MKRILTISTLAIAACVGFTSVASAADPSATSVNSGTVTALCSVTTDGDQVFAATTTAINGVDFTTKLSSTNTFSTLCNTASSTVKIDGTPTTIQYGGDPSVGYAVAATTQNVYTNVPNQNVGIATSSSIAAAHGYSATPAVLTVSPYVWAKPGKVLQNGEYVVTIKATITP